MNFLVIALNTYREGIRKRALIGFLIVALLFISSSIILKTLTPGEQIKIVKDIAMTSLTLFGMMIAIYVSASAVPNEVENRIVHTILSKPISRLNYLLGKFIGIQLIVLLLPT